MNRSDFQQLKVGDRIQGVGGIVFVIISSRYDSSGNPTYTLIRHETATNPFEWEKVDA